MEKIDPWKEEIHGFQNETEYLRFAKWIDNEKSLSIAEEIPQDSNYGKGEIYGGRWFRHLNSGQVWRLVSPDYPFKGLWERINI